jgi:hypothetical protein
MVFIVVGQAPDPSDRAKIDTPSLNSAGTQQRTIVVMALAAGQYAVRRKKAPRARPKQLYGLGEMEAEVLELYG